MLKKISILAFVALIAAGMAFAATSSNASSAKASTAASSTGKTMASSKSAMTKVEGTIQSVDAKTHTITVTVGSDTKTYKYSTKTTVMNDKKAAKLSSLKSGDKVTITVDSKNYARKVDVSNGEETK